MWDFFEYTNKNTANQLLYDRAQQIKSEGYAEEINDIADNAQDPAKARLQIDSRRWYASKIKPEKFGERLDINVSKTIDIRAAMLEGRNRMIEAQAVAEASDPTEKSIELPHRDLKNVVDVQSIDLTGIKQMRDMGHKPLEQVKPNTIVDKASQNDGDDIYD